MGCTISKSSAVSTDVTPVADKKILVDESTNTEIGIDNPAPSMAYSPSDLNEKTPDDIISCNSETVISSVVGGVTLLTTGIDIVSKSFIFGIDTKSFDYKANRVPSDFKILHFVRHAEGLHNVAEAKEHSNVLSEEWEDAVLSENGIIQCKALADDVSKYRLAKDAQLLLVSPMRRTLQTASLSFPNFTGKMPWIAHESLREQSGLHPCDRRRPKSELSKQFANVNFDLIDSELDPLYPKYGNSVREPDDAVLLRGQQFLQWLANRPEREIVIVTHSAYLMQLLGRGKVIDVEDSSPEKFANCEMRSYSVCFTGSQTYHAEKTL